MRPEQVGEAHAPREPYESLAEYPLLKSLIERRSRHFAGGMSLNGDRWPTRARAARDR